MDHGESVVVCKWIPEHVGACLVQGIADVLLDENQTAQVARPGTSLARPMTSVQVRREGGKGG